MNHLHLCKFYEIALGNFYIIFIKKQLPVIVTHGQASTQNFVKAEHFRGEKCLSDAIAMRIQLVEARQPRSSFICCNLSH